MKVLLFTLLLVPAFAQESQNSKQRDQAAIDRWVKDDWPRIQKT